MENAGYIFTAFAVVWALVFGYVFFLVRKQAGIQRELDSLQRSQKEGPAWRNNT